MQDWSSSTFYYNGSMVCMFPSQIANQPMPNVSTSLYSVPTRRWTYDNKLSTSAPSNAPNITVSSKGRWAILTNGAMSF